MKVLYIEEGIGYSETFISDEKKYLINNSVAVESLYLKDLNIGKMFFINLPLVFLNYKIFFNIFFLFIHSMNNGRRLLSNMHAIMLFISNMHLLKKNNDILHIRVHFLAKRSTMALLLSTYLKTSFSVVAHAADIFDWDNSIKYKIYKADTIYAISNYNIGYLNAKTDFKYSEKIKLIRNSFNFQSFSNGIRKSENNKILFTIVSRLVDKKGIIDFLNIFKIYNNLYNNNSKLKIIGDGPLYSIISEFIKENKLEKNVELKGVCNTVSIKNTLIKSNFLVLLSKNATHKSPDMDGLPTVFFEALSLGLPIISTEVSGIPELLINGENAITVDIGLSNESNAINLHNSIIKYKFNDHLIRTNFNSFIDARYGAKVFLDYLKSIKYEN